MARKSQGGSRNSKGANRGPNWTPYLAVLGLALVVAAFFTTQSGGQSENGRPAKASTRTVQQMEQEVHRLYLGLSSVGERGTSGIFGKIKAMADQAQGALKQAAEATSDAEKKRILEEALESKGTWLLTLQDHAAGLKQEEAEDLPGAEVTSDAVSVLSISNFSNFVASNPRTMVQFYAPWCPHCKKFAPEFAKSGEEFLGRAAFAIVNGEEEKQLSRVYGVGGYPTLKWMVSGRAIDYDGPRTHEHLSKWVEERLQPAYVEFDSPEDPAAALQAVEDGDGSAKMCIGEGQKDSRRFQAFLSAAEHFRGKLVFTWSPPRDQGGDGQLRLHVKGIPPFVCGSEAGNPPNASACMDADEVIAWLEDKLLLDPDLQ